MAIADNYLSILGAYYWYPGTEAQGRPIFLTYSFSSQPTSGLQATNPSAAATFTPLNQLERAAVRTALDMFASASGLLFFETTTNEGDITFGHYNTNLVVNDPSLPPGFGLGYGPNAGAFIGTDGQPHVYSSGGSYPYLGGDVYFGSAVNVAFALHEIGHALGFKHPAEPSNLNPNVTSTNGSGFTVLYNYNSMSTLGTYDYDALRAVYGQPTADGTHVTNWSWNQTTETLTQVGTTASEFIRGTGANDVIYLNGGNDAVFTAQGDDRIVATGQSFEFSGGTGVDTVVTGLNFQGLSSIGGSGPQHYIAVSGGYQIYWDVERIQFNNAYVALDIEGHAGDAYRIYQAAFDRTPDRPGLSYWVNQMDDGMPLSQVALNFILSPEFAATYGNINAMSNAQFVNVVYDNVLHRAPDTNGFDYWMNDLANGFPRHFMLAAFSQSAENQANVAAAIQNGILLDLGAFV